MASLRSWIICNRMPTWARLDSEIEYCGRTSPEQRSFKYGLSEYQRRHGLVRSAANQQALADRDDDFVARREDRPQSRSAREERSGVANALGKTVRDRRTGNRQLEEGRCSFDPCRHSAPF